MVASNMSDCSTSNSDALTLRGDTFVLVHGAYHGGWCWRAVADALQQAGHSVFTPTLTGLGERRHLMSAALSIDTFVADIMNVIEIEDLSDITLVGHSFAGMVITGVADRMPQRLKRLVYLDAITPIAGKSVFDMMPAAESARRLATLATLPGGETQAPQPPAAYFGIENVTLAAWVDRRLTPHPVGGWTSPLALANPITNGVPATYIRCTAPIFPSNDPCAAFATAQPSWQYLEIAAGHDAMISAPAELASLLLRLEKVPISMRV